MRGGDAAAGVVGIAGSDDGSAGEALGELGFGDLLSGVAGDYVSGFVTKDADSSVTLSFEPMKPVG